MFKFTSDFLNNQPARAKQLKTKFYIETLTRPQQTSTTLLEKQMLQ